jgi:MFS family permease
VLRGDLNFTRYLMFSTIFSLGGMAAGFLIVYSSKTWNLPDSVASGYIIALQVGQALGNLFFGFLSDRKGHKLSLEIAVILGALSFLLPLVAPDPLWFYAIFFLRGAVFAAMMVSGVAIVMEFTEPENRPTYFGLANTIPGIASSVAPLIGGWLAQVSGYPALFLLSTILSVASFIMLRWAVIEPRGLKNQAALINQSDKRSAPVR